MHRSTKYILLGIGFILLTAGFYVFYLQYNPPSSAEVSSSDTSTQTVPNSPTQPVRLIIPSIGVNAAVEHLGLTAAGAVAVPSGPYDVAWFDKGTIPGQPGSAVISGHFGPWKSGAHSVFDNLNKLQPGDTVSVQDGNGKVATFVVISSQTYPPSAIVPDIFHKNDGSYLNLITCNGDWLPDQKTYTQRLVVFTKLQP